jgi:hypothetical protein
MQENNYTSNFMYKRYDRKKKIYFKKKFLYNSQRDKDLITSREKVKNGETSS